MPNFPSETDINLRIHALQIAATSDRSPEEIYEFLIAEDPRPDTQVLQLAKKAHPSNGLLTDTGTEGGIRTDTTTNPLSKESAEAIAAAFLRVFFVTKDDGWSEVQFRYDGSNSLSGEEVKKARIREDLDLLIGACTAADAFYG